MVGKEKTTTVVDMVTTGEAVFTEERKEEERETKKANDISIVGGTPHPVLRRDNHRDKL
jgi:hypothetical protein